MLQTDPLTIPTVVPDSLPTINPPKIDLEELSKISWGDIMTNMVDGLIDFAIHIGVAILVFYVGKFIIRRMTTFLKALMVKRETDRSLATFILSLVKIVLLFILIIITIGILGINTSSFIALFASAGIAVGMALSGTLQNFAGGVLILLLKPYRIGDYIEAQGFEGYVTEIQIFHTIISTYDNKSIIVPNGPLSTGSINNYSREKYRRVEWKIALCYGVDLQKAREVILEILTREQRLIKASDIASNSANDTENQTEGVSNDSPTETKKKTWWRRIFCRRKSKVEQWAAQSLAHSVIPSYSRLASVSLNALDDSSIDVRVRAWTESALYWPVYYSVLELLYTELPKAGITFPFPQLDIHLNSTPDKQ